MKYRTDKVTIDHWSMSYLQFGHGQDVLVILPGLSVQSPLMAAPAIVKQYERFIEDYTVYVFDRRSEVPAVYSMQEMAQDTAKAIHKLKLSSVSLFGASQGGSIAMVIAAAHPELVRCLAVASTTVCISEKRFSLFAEWIALAQKQDREGLYRSFAQKLYPSTLYEQLKDGFAAIAKTVTEDELERFMVLAQSLKDFDIRNDSDNIQCPVLLVSDETDAVFNASAALEIVACLRSHNGFEHVRFNGYGHALYDTAPEFKEILYRFLTKHRDR